MPNTFTLIASSTVGAGGAASIDFTSIPSTYTDLCLKYSLRNTTSEIWVNVKLNNATTNFSLRWLQGNGASAGSSNFANNVYMGFTTLSTDTTSTFSNGELYFPNYAGSTNKSFSSDMVTENNGTTAYAQMNANLWSNTAVINQITLVANTGNLAQYSTAYLYGIIKS